MIWGTLALAFAAAFTGASFYVNWVEQPARLKLDDAALLSEWGPSDSRGVALLAALALLSAIAGFIAYFQTEDVRWAFGAVIIIASWLYAFFVMSPLDNQVRSLRGGDVGAARALVRQWGIVESGLTAIGTVAVLVFLWAAPLRGAPHGVRLARPPRACGARHRRRPSFFHPPQRRRAGAAAPLDIARIAWAAPVAGAVVGLIGALVLALTALLGLPLLASGRARDGGARRRNRRAA